MNQKKVFAISVALLLLSCSIPLIAASQLRIVCIGNSITQGKMSAGLIAVLNAATGHGYGKN